MIAALRSWTAWVGRRHPMPVGALVSAVVILGLVGFLPLFGQPGYELSLAAGLVLPAIAAVSASMAFPKRGGSVLAFVLDRVATGVMLTVAAVGVGFLHGFRTSLCAPMEGSAIIALGAGAGAVMGGLWGTGTSLALALWGGKRLQRRSVHGLVALSGPVLGILISLGRFYFSPMVFALDPFFGYFAGPLYDTINQPLPLLTSYRIGSLLTVLTVLALAAQLQDTGEGRLHFRLKPTLMLCVVITGGLSLLITAFGAELGHFSTERSIRKELSATTGFGRCAVYHHPSYSRREALLLAKDCAASLSRLESWFELQPGTENVAVYLFQSPSEKGRLMGASGTYVAKPWRREIYLHAQGFPHPVVQHELAHVVAGRFGQGPMHIAGPLWGLLPDPGRIEGYAVAAAPQDGPQALQKAARAMQKLELLPAMGQVFSLSFIGYNSSTGYATAGAFVAWLRAEVGAQPLRAWYSGTSVDRATGQSLASLEKQWHKSLAAIALSQAELASATMRFDRPAIFYRVCPRLVDRLQGDAFSRLAQGDLDGAERDFKSVLEADPGALGAELGIAACSMRRGQGTEARRRYDDLLRRKTLTALQRASVQEALGDLLLTVDNGEQATELYERAAKVFDDESRLRALEVKAQSSRGASRSGIIALLLGDRTGATWPEAVEELARWSVAQPNAGLADYLLAKNWYARGEYERSERDISRALARGGLGTLTQREAWSVALLTACVQGNRQRFAELVSAMSARGSGDAESEQLRSLVDRCYGVMGLP